jgi:hypothetical protein
MSINTFPADRRAPQMPSTTDDEVARRLFGQEVCEGLFPLFACSAMLSKKTGQRSTGPDLPAQ